MVEAKPPYNLIIHPDYLRDLKDSPESKKISEGNLEKLENIVVAIGEARRWGGNPRYDLILEEGIKAYLSGEVDKRNNK